MSRAKKTASEVLASRELLSFAEAANQLGVDMSKLRRMIFEDLSLAVVRVDSDGNRSKCDIRKLIADRGLMVDEQGYLRRLTNSIRDDIKPIPRGELGMPRIGMILRISAVELERFRSTALGRGSPAAPTPRAATRKRRARSNAPGLTPRELATAFDGILRSQAEWEQYLSKSRTPWHLTEPVLPASGRGRSGSGANRKKTPHRRDPVEFARYLLAENGNLWRRLDRRFKSMPALAPWRDQWDAEEGA